MRNDDWGFGNPARLLRSYRNTTTDELVTCEGFLRLAKIKARSLAKGHIWLELRAVPVTWHEREEGTLVPVPLHVRYN